MHLILPSITNPPPDPIFRDHNPPRRQYRQYLPCLRWEFGFTCIFCLLHETDYVWHGVKGSGEFWVEHHFLQSEEPSLADHYPNCFYACQYCNRARGKRPRRSEEGRWLVNPSERAWGDHVKVVEGRIEGTTPDGHHTVIVYRLNQARKIKLRQNRERKIQELLAVMREGRELAQRLRQAKNLDRRVRFRALLNLEEARIKAEYEAARWSPIPEDSDPDCICEARKRLPDWLKVQCVPYESTHRLES